MILTILGYAAVVIATLGTIAQGIGVSARVQPEITDIRSNKQNWAVTLKQLKALKAKIASIEQFA